MIGTAQMRISKEQMIAIVEYYLNKNLFNTTFEPQHKVKVVDQIRKSGDRFVITAQIYLTPQGVREHYSRKVRGT